MLAVENTKWILCCRKTDVKCALFKISDVQINFINHTLTIEGENAKIKTRIYMRKKLILKNLHIYNYTIKR